MRVYGTSLDVPSHQSFSRSLRVHLVNDTTIISATTPKSNINLTTNMNMYNVFGLLVDVVFATRPQLGCI